LGGAANHVFNAAITSWRLAVGRIGLSINTSQRVRRKPAIPDAGT
jgi:hypothetical protein